MKKIFITLVLAVLFMAFMSAEVYAMGNMHGGSGYMYSRNYGNYNSMSNWNSMNMYNSMSYSNMYGFTNSWGTMHNNHRTFSMMRY